MPYGKQVNLRTEVTLMTLNRLAKINGFCFQKHFYLTAQKSALKTCSLACVIAPSSIGKNLTKSVIKKRAERGLVLSDWTHSDIFINTAETMQEGPRITEPILLTSQIGILL